MKPKLGNMNEISEEIGKLASENRKKFISNASYWEEIESSDPFKIEATDADSAWNWLEKLQQGGRLTRLDIICLKGLLDAVYSSGKNADMWSREHA